MKEQVLSALAQRANHHGLVIVRETVLLQECRLASREFRNALTELEKDRAIEVLSPPPFIALRLRKWPGEGGNAADSAEHAYSYSKPIVINKAIKADSYRPEEVATSDGLLHEILETLGETDPRSFRMAVDKYSPQVIRTALSRVRRAKSIRKSRTALFRHLLPRIAQNQQTS